MKATLPTAPARHVYGLDFLRFSAAVLVASLHLWGSETTSETGLVNHLMNTFVHVHSPFLGHTFPPLAFIGAIGVPIFFTISGFVISYSSHDISSAVVFLYRRAMRLAPALWICTIISMLIAVATGFYAPDDAALRFLRSIFLTPIGAHIDDVVWTLVLEVVFYGYIAVLVGLGRMAWLPKLSLALSVATLIFWGSAFSAGCVLGEPAKAGLCGLYGNPYFEKLTSIFLIQQGSFFAIGISTWMMWYGHPWKDHLPGVVLGVFVSIFQVVWLSGYYFEHYGNFGASRSPALMLAVWAAGLCVFFASCYWSDAVYARLRAHAGFVRLVGLSTYPLYLLHGFVGGAAMAFAVAMGFVGLAQIFGIFAAIAVSMVVAQYLEPRLRKVLSLYTRDWFEQQRAEAVRPSI